MFSLSPEQSQKLNEWLENHDRLCPHAKRENQGAIGGRLTYEFTPTSLGIVIKVKCACGTTNSVPKKDSEIDLTDYDMW